MITDIGSKPRVDAADAMLRELAERVGGSARAEAIFGEPVERGGVTVIPVAKLGWGLGGGSRPGSGKAREPGPGEAREPGAGAGAGMGLKPVGYVEIRDGETRFRPILDPTAVLGAAVGVAVLAFLLLRRLVR